MSSIGTFSLYFVASKIFPLAAIFLLTFSATGIILKMQAGIGTALIPEEDGGERKRVHCGGLASPDGSAAEVDASPRNGLPQVNIEAANLKAYDQPTAMRFNHNPSKRQRLGLMS